MTPPKLDRVDIRDLRSVHFERLFRRKPDELAPLLRGSDLTVEAKTGELKRLLAGGRSESRSLEEEAAWVRVLRGADRDGDGALTSEEARAALAARLSPEQAGAVDPERFLASIERLMRERYRPIAQNFRAWAMEETRRPALDAIKDYAEGLQLEELRQARSVFPLNALHKTAGNFLAWIPQNLIRRPLGALWDKLRGKKSDPLPWFPCDAAAEAAVRARDAARRSAIGALDKALRADPKATVASALERLGREDPRAAEILARDLAALRLDGFLGREDPKARYRALLDFAKGERPGFLGFGSGNTRFRHFWNYTGSRHNLYFARSVLKFLGAKAATGDASFDKSLRREAKEQRLAMLGDGGNFSNLFLVGLTRLTSLFGLLHKPLPYRRWGDEDMLDVVGRGLDMGLAVYGGGKAWTALAEARGLSKLRGWKETGRIWGQGLRSGRPLPVSAWREARLLAEKEGEILGAHGIQATPGRLGRGWRKVREAVADRLFQGLPPLTAAQREGLRRFARQGGGLSDKLVKGVVLLGVAQFADRKMKAPFNPFLLNHQMDLDRYPDPTRELPMPRPKLIGK